MARRRTLSSFVALPRGRLERRWASASPAPRPESFRANLSMQMHICRYIYICIYTYPHTCTHAYIHTYIYIYISCTYVRWNIHQEDRSGDSRQPQQDPQLAHSLARLDCGDGNIIGLVSWFLVPSRVPSLLAPRVW